MNNRHIRIKSGETVPLQLSNRERLLILNETAAGARASQEILDKMRIAILKGEGVVFHFTLGELDELAGYVAAAANHTEDKAVEKDLYITS